jgi:hypothetical protein
MKLQISDPDHRFIALLREIGERNRTLFLAAVQHFVEDRIDDVSDFLARSLSQSIIDDMILTYEDVPGKRKTHVRHRRHHEVLPSPDQPISTRSATVRRNESMPSLPACDPVQIPIGAAPRDPDNADDFSRRKPPKDEDPSLSLLPLNASLPRIHLPVIESDSSSPLSPFPANFKHPISTRELRAAAKVAPPTPVSALAPPKSGFEISSIRMTSRC